MQLDRVRCGQAQAVAPPSVAIPSARLALSCQCSPYLAGEIGCGSLAAGPCNRGDGIWLFAIEFGRHQGETPTGIIIGDDSDGFFVASVFASVTSPVNTATAPRRTASAMNVRPSSVLPDSAAKR